jgi:SPP1 family phage portal protein
MCKILHVGAFYFWRLEGAIVELHGRNAIYTSVEHITGENVVKVLSDAYVKHLVNRGQIQYLYNYYRGIQPILDRVKDIRPEICNHIVENRANAIVNFRVGYTVGKPIQYVSSVSDKEVSEQIARMNDMLRMSGKPSKDKQLVEWQMICGTGYRMVLPSTNSRTPFELYTLDPRDAFVIYRNDVAHTQLAGVYYTVDDEKNVTFYMYTSDGEYYVVEGWQNGVVVGREDYVLNQIPIIEYPLNFARMGAFEVVLPLLDQLNNLESNRMDSIEQFVQSLLVAYNCEFPDGTTANTIREAGMVVLKSIGENKADVKVISETLQQGDTQIMKQNIIDSINEIVGIPGQGNGYTSDSSNNGAVILKNGWQGAETRAQDFETMFREPEQRTIELLTEITNRLSDMSLDPDTVDVKFTRRNYEDLLSKSQTLITMLQQDKIHPQCAYEAAGLFVDTQDAYNMGMEWYEKMKEEQEEAEAKAAENGESQGGTYIKGYYQKRGDRP